MGRTWQHPLPGRENPQHPTASFRLVMRSGTAYLASREVHRDGECIGFQYYDDRDVGRAGDITRGPLRSCTTTTSNGIELVPGEAEPGAVKPFVGESVPK